MAQRRGLYRSRFALTCVRRRADHARKGHQEMAFNAIANLQDGASARRHILLAQRHWKTLSMLRVTSFRWQNDAPFCYRCSYVLMMTLTFAHVTSIDYYTPYWGFGGFFAQFSYVPSSA
jgi:hypothetical protein